MESFSIGENKFYEKLKDWYGDYLHGKTIEVLYTVCEEDEVFSVSYLIQDSSNVEIARVFSFFGKVEISIDCQADLSQVEGIKKIIQYGQRIYKEDV